MLNTYNARTEKTRWIETVSGFLMLGAAIAGGLFFEGDKTLMLVFAALGGIFISKTKTLELVEAIKKNIAGGK